MYLGLGNGFLATVPEAQPATTKDKLGFIKIKSFHVVNDTIKKVKRQPTKQENIFANHMLVGSGTHSR